MCTLKFRSPLRLSSGPRLQPGPTPQTLNSIYYSLSVAQPHKLFISSATAVSARKGVHAATETKTATTKKTSRAFKLQIKF